jgi:predicted ester cyclase
VAKDDNKAVAREMLKAWNDEGETHLPDKLLSPDVVTRFHHPLKAPTGRGKRQRVPSEVALPREAFPDQKFTEQILIADDNGLVFIAWDLTATHEGELYGKRATGKQVNVHGCDVVRVQDGKIVEHWDYYTKPRTHALAQLGLLDKRLQRRLQKEGLWGRGRPSGIVR